MRVRSAVRISPLRLLLLCTVVVLGCSRGRRDPATSVDATKPALKFEPKETIAYVGGFSISVYMVADERVLLVTIPLEKRARSARITIPIEETRATAKLYQGKDVWSIVHPGGAGPKPAYIPAKDPAKPPIGPLYTKEAAIAGRVVCSNIPAAETYPYHGDTAISIAEVDVLFPSARLRVSRSMTLTLGAFPP